MRVDEPLESTLLHADAAGDDRPGRRWAYAPSVRLLISCFIAYHALVLLVYNLPANDLIRPARATFDRRLQALRYLQATGNTQNWGMFAPNPFRVNQFLRVRVVDADGVASDAGHDTFGRQPYPNLFYSRMSKINRRITKHRSFRQGYAAWVCRDWARSNDGDPPREVGFVKLTRAVPPPSRSLNRMRLGSDEMNLRREPMETYRCSTMVHGQLPPWLRERYGFHPAPEGTFRRAPMRSWADLRRRTESFAPVSTQAEKIDEGTDK